MMRILKVLFLQIVMIMSSVAAIAAGEGEGNGFDWTPVMDAIIQVESKGNASAVSGQYVGAMQISPICVRECNNILKRRGSSKRFTLKDRYSESKSREMFVVIQSYHNPANNVEKAIRAWNGGNNYSVAKTQNYLNKVRHYMK